MDGLPLPLGSEVANVPVTCVANGPEAEDRFVAMVARSEHVLVRRRGVLAEKDFPFLTSNATHRPAGRNKLRLADVVARFFLPDDFL